ncbi:glycosyl hydrolase family 18 protein [Pyxidicoccus trucidator]|uniref:glycosyl hydrolase family 18 protein n=1 Tax=Pyxidicoccus trucidator TaxID=2709662 RepID=UPI0013DAB63D|nr:glycosyl hydrolase family 18 protein [Pyxidicoccus trucidator]
MTTRSATKPWGAVLLGLCTLLGGCGGGKPDATGLPGAPQAVTAEAADTLALVRWTPPSTDGGNPLMYYMVRCEPICGGAIVTSDVMQATVRGLNNGFSYVFKVSAVNVMGEGPSSLPTETVTPRAGTEVANPTVPGQPRAIRATAGNKAMYLSWVPPASFGGRPLSSYRITVEPGGATVTVPPTEVKVLIPDLLNGVPYRFKVVATNEVGDGPEAATPLVRPQAGGAPASWVSGYWVGYAAAVGSELPVEEVDLSGLTHLIVGRFKPGIYGWVNPDLDIHPNPDHGRRVAKELAQRAREHGRKALMLLGGEGEHDNFVLATAPESRATFVHNLIRLMDELGFDGIDVDWEPIDLAAERSPARECTPNEDCPEETPRPDDGERLLALLDDLRAARPGIILTVPVYPENLNFGISRARAEFMAQLAARVDQLNIMTYAMSYHLSGWESWHTSPVLGHTPNRPASVDGSVQLYLAAGVPAGRLGVGIGFFGQCFRGVTEPRIPFANRPGAYVGPGDNRMSFNFIMRDYYEPRAYRWDDEAQASYLSFNLPAGPELCDYISYEDERSIAAKGRYVRDQGLGGAIIWTINQGYLPREPEGQRNPLIQSLKRAFLDP